MWWYVLVSVIIYTLAIVGAMISLDKQPFEDILTVTIFSLILLMDVFGIILLFGV